MTLLNKPVRRETEAEYRGRNLIVQIEPLKESPWCVIRIKEKGRRTWYQTSINSVFNLAARQHADMLREQRKQRRKERRTT